jgi:hypothetical protein
MRPSSSALPKTGARVRFIDLGAVYEVVVEHASAYLNNVTCRYVSGPLAGRCVLIPVSWFDRVPPALSGHPAPVGRRVREDGTPG